MRIPPNFYATVMYAMNACIYVCMSCMQWNPIFKICTERLSIEHIVILSFLTRSIDPIMNVFNRRHDIISNFIVLVIVMMNDDCWRLVSVIKDGLKGMLCSELPLIILCDQKDEKQTKKSIFSFPKDYESRQKWIRATPRENWEPTQNSGVCPHHFKPDDFVLGRTDTNECRKNKKEVLKLLRVKYWFSANNFPQLPFISWKRNTTSKNWSCYIWWKIRKYQQKIWFLIYLRRIYDSNIWQQDNKNQL